MCFLTIYWLEYFFLLSWVYLNIFFNLYLQKNYQYQGVFFSLEPKVSLDPKVLIISGMSFCSLMNFCIFQILLMLIWIQKNAASSSLCSSCPQIQESFMISCLKVQYKKEFFVFLCKSFSEISIFLSPKDTLKIKNFNTACNSKLWFRLPSLVFSVHLLYWWLFFIFLETSMFYRTAWICTCGWRFGFFFAYDILTVSLNLLQSRENEKLRSDINIWLICSL